MLLIYKPEGSAELRWEFKLGKLRVQETEGIERRTGLAYGTEYKEALLKGQTSARRALLWTMLRRTHHRLLYADVDFADDELTLEMDRDEWQDLYDEIEQVAGLSDEERAFRLGMIGAEIARIDQEARDGEPVDDVDDVDQVPAVPLPDAGHPAAAAPARAPGKAPRRISPRATG